MADMRAMEEQHERTRLDGRRPNGDVGVLVGGGATPSMGLSPYWGGYLDNYEALSLPHLGSPESGPPRRYHGGGNGEQDEEEAYQQLGLEAKPTVGAMKMRVGHGGYRDDEALPRASGSLKRLKGGAKHPKAGNSEAYTMGCHLGKHLHSLHGGDFYSDFNKGYNTAVGAGIKSGQYEGKGFSKTEVAKAKRLAKLHGGAWWDFLDPAKNGLNASVADTKAKFEDAGKKIKNEFENPDSKLRKVADPVIAKVKNEFENPDSKLRGEILPKVAYELGNPDSDFNKKAGDFIEKLPFGIGPNARKAFDVMNDAKRKAGVDKSTVDDYKKLINGKGMPKQKRMVGAGVAKRAEVVKRVMAEKGMKMIEASKYVKAHGLY